MEHIDKLSGTFDSRKTETKAQKAEVSPAVIRRLPRYHRYLGDLLRAERYRISSGELSEIMGVTASQIRQDLNCFGGFGQQGYGYNIKYLYGKISELLGVSEGYRAVIVGAGNLGKALAQTHMFERRGVSRVALFDVNPGVIGTEINSMPVLDAKDLGNFCRENDIKLGVLTVPKDAAKEVAEVMAKSGVRGILNFANMELTLDEPDVIIENVHLGDYLMKLCYEMKRSREDGEK